MANITKTQIKSRLQKLMEELEEIGNKLMDLQEEVSDEANDIEPYEGKNELTLQQEERQEWLEDVANTLEEQIENIRWNQHQLLVCDIKDLLKGKIEYIEIGEINLRKNPLFTNGIFVLEKGRRYGDDDYSTYTKKEVIKLLEERYLI